jgi:hypothetical protein
MPALNDATVEQIIEELGRRDGLHFVLVLLEVAPAGPDAADDPWVAFDTSPAAGGD